MTHPEKLAMCSRILLGRVVLVVKDGCVYDPAAIYRALGIEPCCPNAYREGDER